MFAPKNSMRVRAVLAFDGVVAVAGVPLEDVVAGTQQREIVAAVAEDEIVAVAAEEYVVRPGCQGWCRRRPRRRSSA